MHNKRNQQQTYKNKQQGNDPQIYHSSTIRPLKEKDKGSSHAKYSTIIARKNMGIHDISNDTNIIKDFLEHLRFE